MSHADTHTSRYVSVKSRPPRRPRCVMPESVGPASARWAQRSSWRHTGTGVWDHRRPIPLLDGRLRRSGGRRVDVVACRDTGRCAVARLRQQQREAEARQLAQTRIRERGLRHAAASKVEHAFDGSRLVFYFTAESRRLFASWCAILRRVPHAHRDAASGSVMRRRLGGYWSRTAALLFEPDVALRRSRSRWPAAEHEPEPASCRACADG